VNTCIGEIEELENLGSMEAKKPKMSWAY
jgi:hypothetical protein